MRPGFGATLRSLEDVVQAGGCVAVHVVDLDTAAVVLTGDAHLALPIAGLGMVPLLVETAAGFANGSLDPAEIIRKDALSGAAPGGLWQSLVAAEFSLADLAVLAAATGDPRAAHALLRRIGHERVRVRMEGLGYRRIAIADRFGSAPVAVPVGSARELTALLADLAKGEAVSPAVSARVVDWLRLNQDLALVAQATGLDPLSHGEDTDLMLFNKTGRASGVRAEAGVLVGHRAGVAYTLIVGFEDSSIQQRLRAHDAFRTLGLELMEYVH